MKNKLFFIYFLIFNKYIKKIIQQIFLYNLNKYSRTKNGRHRWNLRQEERERRGGGGVGSEVGIRC